MPDSPIKVFVVEDNEWYNKLLVHNISQIPELEVSSFISGQECLDALKSKPSIVTVDYNLPDMTGSELFKKIYAFDPNIQVIVISEQSEIQVALELLKLGAYDYIIKTEKIREPLIHCIQKLLKEHNLKEEIKYLKRELQTKFDFEKTIIGQSTAIKKIFTLIEKAIRTNITVSITGETGTGKEVVAKAIHYNSNKKDEPFVAVNVAAIPSELVESELFGHEKGAFTGASSTRIGKFEQAQNGTLFLDEIAELDITVQAKLLRVLQEREVTRVGGNDTIKVDCRILVATHRNLLDLVKEKQFREDLYYRLYGLTISLPPLRERDKDVLILAKSFLDGFCKENKLEAKSFSEAANDKLLSYSYPGNIRELKSIIELAGALSDSNIIEAQDIIFGSGDLLSDTLSEECTLREYNKRIVDMFLKKYDNDIKLVAQKLDIGQTTIYRMLKEE
ncbi:MAG: sigma-54 dependent transcriptional regulator [Flavobacteriales bacterium]|nr:sigma-54 dependent transcriptional regulator [Flavobacteriales bacterium]